MKKSSEQPVDRRRIHQEKALDRRKGDDDYAERMSGGIRTIGWRPDHAKDEPTPKKPSK